jgi:hypothetical protein
MAQGQEYSKDQMVALAIGFMILPTVFYGLRVWARMLINRVTLDDYLAGAALVSGHWFWKTSTRRPDITGHRFSPLPVVHFSYLVCRSPALPH